MAYLQVMALLQILYFLLQINIHQKHKLTSFMYLQGHQGHNSGYIITACNQPTAWHQGSTVRAARYTQLLRKNSGWQTPY